MNPLQRMTITSALCLFAHQSTALGADALSIDLSESLGALPAIHGVNGGPLVRKEWRKGSKQPTIDMSQEFAATQIPESRTHDDGSMDMQNLWVPRSDTALIFRNQDPSLDINWSTKGMDRLDERLAAAHNAGVKNFGRCGHSRFEYPEGSEIFPFSTIPDDFSVWAEACAELLERMKERGHTIERVEVWNEPYYTEFWQGSNLEYLQLYSLTRDAIRARFDNAVEVGFFSLAGPWGEEASLAIQERNNDTNDTNDFEIDFISSHFYLRNPQQMADKLHAARVEVVNGRPQKVPPIQQYLELLGLPEDTPSVVSEWNRGTGVGSEYAATAAGLPVLVGGLMHLIDAHPSMSDHHVEMGHFYSARNGLWDEGEEELSVGEPRPAGVLWRIFGEDMLNDAPTRLAIEGLRWTPHATNKDRGESIDAIASRSEDGNTVYLLTGWFDNSEGELYAKTSGEAQVVALQITHAQPGNWHMVHREIVDDDGPFYDRHGKLETRSEESLSVSTDGLMALSLQLKPNSVSVLTLERTPNGDSGDSSETDSGAPEEEDPSCACASPATGIGPAWFLGLWVFLLQRRQRRETSSP